MEHCVSQTSDRFELVAIVSQRARDLASGNASVLQDIPKYSNQKSFSIALHEIDMELLNIEALKERYINSFAPKNLVELQQSTVADHLEGEHDEDNHDSAYYVSGVDLDLESTDESESGEHIFFEDVDIDETEK